MYPKVEVDLANIKFNAERIVSLTKRKLLKELVLTSKLLKQC